MSYVDCQGKCSIHRDLKKFSEIVHGLLRGDDAKVLAEADTIDQLTAQIDELLSKYSNLEKAMVVLMLVNHTVESARQFEELARRPVQ